MLGLAYLMNYSGMTSTLGLALATSGFAFPFFSAVVGWLGVFLTGSDTSSNALFGNLQRITAERLGLEVRQPERPTLEDVGGVDTIVLVAYGVLIPDAFMEAVRDGAEWILRSPKDGSERGKVDARALFQKLVETRLATGEP